MSALISAAVRRLRSDLANRVSATKGAALIGHGSDLQYVIGTVGAGMRDAIRMSAWPGYVGDGIADDTAELNAALATGRDVRIDEGNPRTTATLVSNTVGQWLLGPVGSTLRIDADHTAGPVVQFLQRQCGIADLILNASTTRNAAAVTSNNHGVMIGGAGAGSLTATCLERVIITRQPANAVHFVREGVGSAFRQVQALYNRGHGFFFDDGTYDGLGVIRCGIVSLEFCRSIGNGGNGICLSPTGQTAYRFELDNFETYDCAWNTGIAGLQNAIAYFRSQNVSARECAWGDPGFASVVQPNGDARLAKGIAADGVYLASGSTNLLLDNCRNINTAKSLKTGNGIAGIDVRSTYSNAVQAVGFDLGTTNTAVNIEISDPGQYTAAVVTGTPGGRLVLGDQVYQLMAVGSSHLKIGGAAQVATINADSLNVPGDNVSVAGQGGAADNLQNMYFAGAGTPLPDGFVVRIFNPNAYTITVIHATGNIRTKTGANVALSQNRGMTLLAQGGILYEV